MSFFYKHSGYFCFFESLDRSVAKLERLELTTLVGSPLGPYVIVEIEKLKEGNVYSCSKISSMYVYLFLTMGDVQEVFGIPICFFFLQHFFSYFFWCISFNSELLNSLVSFDLSSFQVLKQIIGLGSIDGPKRDLACHQAFSSHLIRKHWCHLFYCHNPNYILGELGISCFILDFLMSSYHNSFFLFCFWLEALVHIDFDNLLP